MTKTYLRQNDLNYFESYVLGEIVRRNEWAKSQLQGKKKISIAVSLEEKSWLAQEERKNKVIMTILIISILINIIIGIKWL